MSNRQKTDGSTERDEQAIARLIRMSGPRAEIPMAVESRVYAKVQQEWRDSTGIPGSARVYDRVQRSWKQQTLRSRLLRWALPMAAAASAALVAVLITQPEPDPAVGVGTVARVISPATGDGALFLGDDIYTGMTIRTDAGEGYSFLLAGNESLRLDERSAMRVDAAGQFTLLEGRLYADTGELVYRGNGLRIDTQLGTVTDVGTQFAVAVGDGLLDVAVREGRVDVLVDTTSHVAVSGERLRLDDQGGAMVDTVAPTAEFWAWTTQLAPAFDIEGRSLMDFLKWAARESGRSLHFEDVDLRMAAMRTELHGSIADFGPLEAVESVLATTNFRYRIEADRIVIQR